MVSKVGAIADCQRIQLGESLTPTPSLRAARFGGRSSMANIESLCCFNDVAREVTENFECGFKYLSLTALISTGRRHRGLDVRATH